MIKYERVLRDCESNRNGRKPLLYDFDVFIDGERRAVFVKNVFSGYSLYDTNRKPIEYRGRLERRVNQADFDEVVHRNLAKIPTREEQRFDRLYDQACKVNNEWNIAYENRIQKLREEVLREALALYINETLSLAGDKWKVAKALLEEHSG